VWTGTPSPCWTFTSLVATSDPLLATIVTDKHMVRAFLTPSSIPDARRCRGLSIPDSPEWLALVAGALATLIHESDWEPFGAVSPEDAADAAFSVLASYYDEGCPVIGQIAPFYRQSPPSGWLLCDGARYLRVDYPALYDALPTIAHDGDTAFWVPNLGRRVIYGTRWDLPVASTGGAETHTLTVGEMPYHGHVESTAVPTVIPVGPGAPAPSAVPGVGSVGSVGGGQAHNNMPPYYALPFYIRAR
jgi:microcystin-dependent protein